MDISEILNHKDLAKLLNISTNKLTRLTKEGLPCVRLGADRKVFLQDQVLQWLRNRQK